MVSLSEMPARAQYRLSSAAMQQDAVKQVADTPSDEFERRRLILDRAQWRLDLYKAHHDARKPFVESGIRFADIAVRSLLILNGAAALSLLALGGNTIAKPGADYLSKLGPALVSFGWGATFSVATPAIAYVSQIMLLRAPVKRGNEIGHGMRFVAILSWLIGLGCFLWGVSQASSALK